VQGSGEQRIGIVYGIAAYALWGLLTVYWHEMQGLNAFELIGQRVLWSLLVLGVIVAATRQLHAVLAARHDGRLLAKIALTSVLLVVNWTSYVWCVTNGNVVETALGYFISPLLTVLVGVVWLKERLRRAQAAGLVLAALAVVVLAVAYGSVPWYALLIAGSWTAYGVMKRQLPLGAVPSLTLETLMVLPFAILVVALREAGDAGVIAEASTLQLVLLPLSGLATALPLLLFGAAATRVPLTKLGPLQYSVPTINFLLGWAAYGEEVPGWRLVGFLLVWVGLVIVTVDSLRVANRNRIARLEAEAVGASV
jgi:chloramphenicol-sensitive protein RarD